MHWLGGNFTVITNTIFISVCCPNSHLSLTKKPSPCFYVHVICSKINGKGKLLSFALRTSPLYKITSVACSCEISLYKRHRCKHVVASRVTNETYMNFRDTYIFVYWRSNKAGCACVVSYLWGSFTTHRLKRSWVK